MQFQSVQLLQRVEVPNDNLSLEAGMGFLSGGDVLAGARDSDHGNVVVVALEELLGAGNNVAHNNSGSERENNMFVVRVKS